MRGDPRTRSAHVVRRAAGFPAPVRPSPPSPPRWRDACARRAVPTTPDGPGTTPGLGRRTTCSAEASRRCTGEQPWVTASHPAQRGPADRDGSRPRSYLHTPRRRRPWRSSTPGTPGTRDADRAAGSPRAPRGIPRRDPRHAARVPRGHQCALDLGREVRHVIESLSDRSAGLRARSSPRRPSSGGVRTSRAPPAHAPSTRGRRTGSRCSANRTSLRPG